MTTQRPTERTQRWLSFCLEVEGLLEPGNPCGSALEAFLRRELKKAGLNSYSEQEVLAEAVLRGFKLIVEGGVEIVYPRAWIRKTAYHYVHELRRRQSKFVSLDYDRADPNKLPLLDQLALRTDLAILNRAFKELEPEEQRLLQLNIFEGMSCPEIRRLLATEQKTISEAALRKQKERAIKHLREIYHSLRPLAELDGTDN
jgi:DNA-directed RNA polymerase specialized sigma24 family protein